MDILIECSMFISIASTSEAGAIFDRSKNNAKINICIFRHVSSSFGGDHTQKCAGALYKAHGSIDVNLCDFSNCRYTSGINNKGGNVAYIYLTTTKFKLCRVYCCAYKQFLPNAGDSIICGGETYQLTLTDINASKNYLTNNIGSIIYETVTEKKEQIIGRCQIIECSGYRIVWEEYYLSILNTIFRKNTFSENFVFGVIASTSFCFLGNSKFTSSVNNTYQQCTSDDLTIPNLNYDVCVHGNDISYILNHVIKIANSNSSIMKKIPLLVLFFH